MQYAACRRQARFSLHNHSLRVPSPYFPPHPLKRLEGSLRAYLQAHADLVLTITKPVLLDQIGALSAQSDNPILFENIVEKPGFRLCDILVKHRRSQARALGTSPEDFLKTLAFRLRRPPRGFKDVQTGPVKEVIRKGAEVDWSTLPVSTGIVRRPWGVRDFRVLAPDGYYFRFTEGQ